MLEIYVREVKNKIDELLAKKDRIIVGIDGCCAAGKTTLAKQLSEMYECNVFHMDDFFLRPEQRTPERLMEVGGNVDYERFYEEVVLPLLKGESFSYRPYRCSTQTLGNPVEVFQKQLNIIEGTYSLHPRHAQIVDIPVFLSIDEKEQRKRIERRNPDKYDRFVQEWIPKEQQYFRWIGYRD